MCHMREQNLIKFVYTYNRKTKNEDKKFVYDANQLIQNRRMDRLAVSSEPTQ